MLSDDTEVYAYKSLRNIVPRQGTETIWKLFFESVHNIEKYSSPTGDGNNSCAYASLSSCSLRNIVPRQGTETLLLFFAYLFNDLILRNIVPRQGTETFYRAADYRIQEWIEKYSSPTGDGNGIFTVINKPTCFIEKYSSPTGDGNQTIFLLFRLCRLRNIVPRQGTETTCLTLFLKCGDVLRNIVPRQGTETMDKISSIFSLWIEKYSSPTGDGNPKWKPLSS